MFKRWPYFELWCDVSGWVLNLCKGGGGEGEGRRIRREEGEGEVLAM